MARKSDPSDKIIAATLDLAAEKPWQEISMAEIADAAKIKLPKLKQIFSSKLAILDGFSHQIDDKIASGFPPSFPGGATDETIRDQLFDILMARFDELLPHKKAIKSILRETVPFNPAASISGLNTLLRSMQAALQLAGVKTKPPLGCLMTKALMVIYFRSFKTWLEDDSADMAKTMASLDDGLAKAEYLAKMVRKAA